MTDPRYRKEASAMKSLNFSWIYQQFGAIGSKRQYDCTSYPVVQDFKREMWDHVTPGFFRMKAQNAILPVNEKVQLKTLTSFTPGVSIVENRTQAPKYVQRSTLMGEGLVLATAWKGVIPTVGTKFSAGPSNAEMQQLAIAAVAKARQTLFDGATFLAELEKTIAMFTQCVNRYTQRLLVVDRAARVTYRTLRRGGLPLKNAVTFADVFGQTWMEYRYGYTPLAYEVTAMYKQLLELEALFHRVRGRSETEVITVNEVVKTTSGNGYWNQGAYTSGDLYWSCETATGSEYTMEAAALIELANLFRVTTDPLLMGYELIPYSWMADWFTNIGDLIRTFSPFALGVLKSCSVTTRQTNYVRSRLIQPKLPSLKYSVVSHTAATGAVEFTKTHRLPIEPEFTFDFKVELSLNRILDVVALAVGRMSKFLRLLPKERVDFLPANYFTR